MKYTQIVLAVLVGWAATATASAQDPPAAAPPPVLNNDQLLHKYVWATLGTEGALHATLGSALDQWRDSPDEWGTDAKGYAQRWASEFAQSAIGSTTKYAVARLFHHDPSFTRCECTGLAPRLRHALSSPFMARTRDGRRVVSPATMAGLVAENVIPPITWYPTERGTRDGFRHAATGVISKMGVSVFREFVRLPWRRNPQRPGA